MANSQQSSFQEMPLPELSRSKQVYDDKKGHRARLRERFLACEGASMPDYEILEMVLFSAFRNGDTKPLAKRLLKEFGDFDRVISAPQARLMQVDGIGPGAVAVLKVIEVAAQRLSRAKVIEKDVISSWDDLVAYCNTRLAQKETEQFHVLFLDRKNGLIADEPQQKGTVDHVPVYPREVAKRALELNASALILVHNHPSGDPSPSDADIQMTHQIERALGALGITLHDHIIIGKEQIASFHEMDLL